MPNTFDSQELLSLMVSAAQDIAENKWDDIKETAEIEFEMILYRIEKIENRLAAGSLPEDEAKFLLSLEVSASQIVLTRIEVLRNLEVQRIVNAVLNAIGSIVNGVVKFDLIEIEN